VAQPASARPAAATIARITLLRQHFEGSGVRSPAFLHAWRRGLFVLHRDFEPVHARRRPGDEDLAVIACLEGHFFGRIAISGATGDDLHVQVFRGFAIQQEAEFRRFTRVQIVRMLNRSQLEAHARGRLHRRRRADAHERLDAPLHLLDFEFGRVGGNSGRHLGDGATPAFGFALFFPSRHHRVVRNRDSVCAGLAQLEIEDASRAALGGVLWRHRLSFRPRHQQ
jgi:hypothetical protein